MNEIINPTTVSITNGISIITAVKNRDENLMIALKSWLKNRMVNEVIIVDWNSENQISQKIREFKDKRIVLIEVKNKKDWALSEAFNLAARFSTKEKILKLDADIILKKDFFDKNILNKKEFICGDYRILKKEEKGLFGISGTLFCFREDFFSIGGYDELIRSYGRDDLVLYDELKDQGLIQRGIDLESLEHLEHNDEKRIENQPGVMSVQKEIKTNIIRTEIRKRYQKKKTRFTINGITEGYTPYHFSNYLLKIKNNRHFIIEDLFNYFLEEKLMLSEIKRIYLKLKSD